MTVAIAGNSETGAARQRVTGDRDRADEARQPKQRPRPIADPDDRHCGRGRRQQSDDDGRVAGTRVTQRQGGQHPKPIPQPSATAISPAQSPRLGSGAPPARRQTAAIAAATTERPAPTRSGSNPRSASVVAGNVSEKASTPNAAQPRLGNAISALCRTRTDDPFLNVTLQGILSDAGLGAFAPSRDPGRRATRLRTQPPSAIGASSAYGTSASTGAFRGETGIGLPWPSASWRPGTPDVLRRPRRASALHGGPPQQAGGAAVQSGMSRASVRSVATCWKAWVRSVPVGWL
jgi:hypothetical protein